MQRLTAAADADRDTESHLNGGWPRLASAVGPTGNAGPTHTDSICAMNKTSIRHRYSRHAAAEESLSTQRFISPGLMTNIPGAEAFFDPEFFIQIAGVIPLCLVMPRRDSTIAGSTAWFAQALHPLTADALRRLAST